MEHGAVQCDPVWSGEGLKVQCVVLCRTVWRYVGCEHSSMHLLHRYRERERETCVTECE